jgi:cell division protein FtsN
MDFKFSKGTGDVEKQEAPGEKKNQSALLLLLLLLAGGFSYVYFFTDLIRPQEAPKQAEAPVQQVVKMPLPVTGSTAAPPDQKAVVAKSEPVAPKEEPSKNLPPKPAPVAPAVAVPAAAVPAKLPPPVKQKEESAKTAPVKPADKKTAPEPALDKKDQKTAAAKVEEKKPVVDKTKTPAAKSSEPVKSADKKNVEKVPSKHKKTVAASADVAKNSSEKSDAVGSWSVLVGQYSIEEALSADMGRVRKAGFEPVVTAGPRKKSAMNRLLLGEYANRADAQTELSKLKRLTSDAFVIDQSGKYLVFAGSYLLDARASSEKERLAAAGSKVSIKRAEIAIPTQNLTVGPFNEKKAADAALVKLNANGVKASLIRQ